MFRDLHDDQLTDEKRRVRRAVHNNQHTGLLTASILLPSDRFAVFRAAKSIWNGILFVLHRMVDVDSDAIVRELS